MMDLDGTHTEITNPEKLILCKVQLQLPKTTTSMLDIKSDMPKMISKQTKLVA